MTDVGDSVDRVESLLEEFTAFQKSSYVCICYCFIFPLKQYYYNKKKIIEVLENYN
jgi:hypothetical protein